MNMYTNTLNGGGGNSLNLIHMHSKNVFDNIIRDSDLNGTIVVGSRNVWNLFNTWVILQDNKSNEYYLYNYTSTSYDHYVDKSSVEYNTILGIRFLIKYRE